MTNGCVYVFACLCFVLHDKLSRDTFAFFCKGIKVRFNVIKDIIILLGVFYITDLIASAVISPFILNAVQPEAAELFEKGLAYKKEMAVNWCTSCKCVLANEEVVNGVCERCGSQVIHKEKSQWMLRMSDYSEDLLKGLEDTNFADILEKRAKEKYNKIVDKYNNLYNLQTVDNELNEKNKNCYIIKLVITNKYIVWESVK